MCKHVLCATSTSIFLPQATSRLQAQNYKLFAFCRDAMEGQLQHLGAASYRSKPSILLKKMIDPCDQPPTSHQEFAYHTVEGRTPSCTCSQGRKGACKTLGHLELKGTWHTQTVKLLFILKLILIILSAF